MADASSKAVGWSLGFGGAGNAVGLRLVGAGGTSLVAVADTLSEQVRATAFMQVMVLPPCTAHVPVHPMVGRCLATTSPQAMEAVQGRLTLVLNDGRFETPIEGISHSFDRVSAAVFLRSPDWGENRSYNSIVTVVFRLHGGDRPDPDTAPLSLPSPAGSCGPCDELGLVLLDWDALLGELRREGRLDAPDLIEVLGTTEVGTQLVQRGELIPIWGHRPWLYRLVPDVSGSWNSLGALVGRQHRVPRPSPEGSLLVAVPGRHLRGWQSIKPELWPTVELRDPSARSLQVELWNLPGYEPIAPQVEVGVLPSIVVRELADAPEEADDETSLPDLFGPVRDAGPWGRAWIAP